MLIIHSLYSKSMGSDAHFHRMQPWCRRLLPPLLFPIPGPITETPQICHPVSCSTDPPLIFIESQYIPYFAHPPGGGHEAGSACHALLAGDYAPRVSDPTTFQRPC